MALNRITVFCGFRVFLQSTFSIHRRGLGSDCCGLSSDFLALRLCGIQVDTKFVSEVDSSKIKMLKEMHARYGCTPKIQGDITLRDPEMSEYCDLFVTGAPCPAFSNAGKMQGLRDERGVVLLHSIHYAVVQRPRVFIAENVKGLNSQKDLVAKIVEALRNAGYSVQARLVNTSERGIPQNRERFYLVAIQKDFLKKKFKFPATVAMPKLERFLVDDTADQATEISQREQEIYNFLKTKKGLGPPADETDEVVMDVGATQKFAQAMIGVCPCLTKTWLDCSVSASNFCVTDELDAVILS